MWSGDLIVITIGGVTYYVLVFVCCYCKYVLLLLLTDKSATSTASGLRNLIATFGVPQQLRVDGGREFDGDFASLCEAHSIDRHVSPPYHSRGNGQVERFNRTVQSLLRRCLFAIPNPTADMVRMLLQGIQLALNITTHRAIRCPPYLLMFGTMPHDSGSVPLPALSAEPSATELATYR